MTGRDTTRHDDPSFDAPSFRKIQTQIELARSISLSLRLPERNYNSTLNNVVACSLIDTRLVRLRAYHDFPCMVLLQ